MSLKIVKLNDQAKGSFAGGAILENKPIGFPQDGGAQKPYSNLFYWANAWSNNGGLIGEHPHKWFEIMSFVIEGEIQHYDSKYQKWLPLKAGDAQIIRSGNGISHAEKIMEGGRMFQIWFDPNIQHSMNKEASYNDYRSEEMKYSEHNGMQIKNYVGNGGPVEMDSEGVVINQIVFPAGQNELELNNDKIHSFYLIKGTLNIDGKEIEENDYFIIEDENKISIHSNNELILFHIEVPQKLTYKTYLELVKFS